MSGTCRPFFKGVLALSVIALLGVLPTTIASADSSTGDIVGVVANSSGQAVAGVCVDAITSTGEENLNLEVTTAADGTYDLTDVPPGSYYVFFSMGCGATKYVDAYYLGASGSPTLISVTAGGTVTGINIVLATGATISGTMTDADGNPVVGDCVYAESGTGGIGVAVTGSDGSYSIQGLKPGTYAVEFPGSCFFAGAGATFDGNQADVFYNDTQNGTPFDDQAEPVTTSTSNPATGIDVEIEAPGTITGYVTLTGDGVINELCIQAQSVRGDGTDATDYYAQDDLGEFNLAGLAPGNYIVEIDTCSEYDDTGTTPGFTVGPYYGAPQGKVTTNISDAEVFTVSPSQGAILTNFTIPQTLTPEAFAFGAKVSKVSATNAKAAKAIEAKVTSNVQIDIVSYAYKNLTLAKARLKAIEKYFPETPVHATTVTNQKKSEVTIAIVL